LAKRLAKLVEEEEELYGGFMRECAELTEVRKKWGTELAEVSAINSKSEAIRSAMRSGASRHQ